MFDYIVPIREGGTYMAEKIPYRSIRRVALDLLQYNRGETNHSPIIINDEVVSGGKVLPHLPADQMGLYNYSHILTRDEDNA